MQNPYSTPATMSEPKIKLLPEQEFLLLGNSLYCSAKVDISEYCFMTGGKGRHVVKSIRLNGATPIYRCFQIAFPLTWMLAFWAGVVRPENPALAIGSSLILVLIFILTTAISRLFFVSMKVAFTSAMAWRNFRIERDQAGLVVPAFFMTLGIGFILRQVVSQTSTILACLFVFFTGAILITFNYFDTRQSKLSVTRIGVNLFRVDNLPSELLAKLRETSGADEPA